MRINSHAGHGKQDSKSCGAYTNLLKESVENRDINKDVIYWLSKGGAKVFDCTVDYPLSQSDCINKIVRNCNGNNVDLDISIHFNSGRNDLKGNGSIGGVECLCYDNKGTSKAYADRICKGLASLGFTNRGVKYNTNLGYLRNTKAQAIIIEVCFVDDKDDVELYKKVKSSIGKKIAEAILIKNIGEVNDMYNMDKIVLYSGDIDVLSAIIVAQKHRCPVMKKSDFEASKLKVKEILQVGGKSEDTDRFKSFVNSTKLL